MGQKRKGKGRRVPPRGAPAPDAPSTMGAGEFKVIPELTATEDVFGDLTRRGWRLAPGADLVQPIISAAEWAEMDREHAALMPGNSPR
jgi:hypothetical protein